MYQLILLVINQAGNIMSKYLCGKFDNKEAEEEPYIPKVKIPEKRRTNRKYRERKRKVMGRKMNRELREVTEKGNIEFWEATEAKANRKERRKEIRVRRKGTQDSKRVRIGKREKIKEGEVRRVPEKESY